LIDTVLREVEKPMGRGGGTGKEEKKRGGGRAPIE